MKRLRHFSNPHNHHSLFSHPKTPPFHPPISPPPKILVASHEPTSSSNFSNPNHFPTKSAHPSLISPISSLGSLHLYTGSVDKGLLTRAFQSFCSVSAPGASGSDENDRFGNMGIDAIRPNANAEQVVEIIDMVRRGESDFESRLNSMNVSLSLASIAQIFQVLNSEKVSALCLFDWIRVLQPSCYGDDVCSLVVDNCGRLGDYPEMLRVLIGLRPEQIRLTPKAFGFLSVSSSKKDCITKVVEVLNEVGGSCRSTGVRALIEILCGMGSFKLARFVIGTTEAKRSYYNIMIGENCRRGNLGKAIDMIEEMSEVGCDPDAKTYNLILGSLCKKCKSADATTLFEQMVERNCHPDEITYEIFICHSCKVGNLDLARQLLDEMVLKGIEPRLATHAAFVKVYFYLRRYKEAYKYVVDSSVKYGCYSNAVYSLLAKLYVKEGNAVVAHNILTELINKGLRPESSVYTKVLKELSNTGRRALAEELESKFSGLA